MKIIEALKKIKDLTRKADDLRKLMQAHSAITSIETPKYDDQALQMSKWMQAHADIMKEILDLRLQIQRTNLVTMVTIDMHGKQVTKSIAAWIHRRRDLAALELMAWHMVTDRNIHEGTVKSQSGDMIDVRIKRFYSPAQKDEMCAQLSAEPSIIDGKLEVVNAITDLFEE